jgi:2-polyprenyl-3-methyl-5-hydroxy-6-metoxy-1,4-benzoquinol methylase
VLAPEDLEWVRCDLCGGAEADPVFTRPDNLHAVACRHCGLCFLNPRPKPAAIANLYSADYFATSDVRSGVGYAGYSDPKQQAALRQAVADKLSVALSQREIEDRTILEVGCATGELCAVLKNRRAKPVGLDLSADVIKEARRRYPELDLRQGELASLPADEIFDAIIAFEVLEHVLSPRAFFETAALHLAPGGFLVLSTPNLDFGSRIGFDRWAGFNKSFEHVFFFSPAVLERYASRTGFRVRDWHTAGGGVSLAESRALAAHHVVKTALQRLGLLKVLRRLRETVSRPPRDAAYEPGCTGHNLIAVLVRQPVSLRAPEGGGR